MSWNLRVQLILIVCLAVATAAAPALRTDDSSPFPTHRFKRDTSERIFSPVVVPIQSISNTVLSLICSTLSFASSTINVIGRTILIVLIPIVNLLSTTLGIVLPQLTVPLAVIQTVLTFANATITNITGAVSLYGCKVTTGVGSIINNIASAIIGL
ncbi:hypothetical protein JTB14_032775 [Gonioctena quinquepunctata]|nr:hypothetical protein JTB14_032775 [Gonioctena quinquepunctata]